MADDPKPGDRYRERNDFFRIVLIPSNKKLALLNEQTWTLDPFNMWPSHLAEVLERDGLVRVST